MPDRSRRAALVLEPRPAPSCLEPMSFRTRIAGATTLATLGASLAKGLAAAPVLHRELAACGDSRVVTLRCASTSADLRPAGRLSLPLLRTTPVPAPLVIDRLPGLRPFDKSPPTRYYEQVRWRALARGRH